MTTKERKTPADTIEYIEWVDSYSVHQGWLMLDEFEPDTPTIRTIGWVIHETDKLVAVCANIGEETKVLRQQGNGILIIPKIAIQFRKKFDLNKVVNLPKPDKLP